MLVTFGLVLTREIENLVQGRPPAPDDDSTSSDRESKMPTDCGHTVVTTGVNGNAGAATCTVALGDMAFQEEQSAALLVHAALTALEPAPMETRITSPTLISAFPEAEPEG